MKVALIGFGTIGTGVAKILLEHKERITRATGKNVELARICDKEMTRDRGIDLPEGMLTDHLDAILDDRSISVAIELVGGLDPARSIVESLLKSGKDVVTANKALLATHGSEIFDTARNCGRLIAFEAAVGGGIPIINAISTSLQANKLRQIQAIVNGTCNFILTAMEEKGTDYKHAVAEAQRLGYAEANPTLDVDGTDTAQKLAILSHLAFGVSPNWRDIPRVGIDTVEAVDIVYAKRLGYRIKLLAKADATPDGVELYVSPTLVRLHTPIAEMRDSFNIVKVVGDAVGEVVLLGRGAGEMPTASAVVGDVIDTVLGRAKMTFDTLQLWSKDRPAKTIKDPADIRGKNYLRFLVEDRPGVLAEISGILGHHGISIASVLQEETDLEEGSPVTLIIMTHAAREGDTQAAIAKIDALPWTSGKTLRMRIE
ncbi:MAG: homoserine dehydrogenase [Planctomycetaceae bacterium]|nr:homoserine dehydrogenase [Planctomycetaceae bacterium]